MINVNEAKAVLISISNECNFNYDSPNPKLAWEIFKKFFNSKIDCANDSLLFQCGVYNFTGEDLFHFEFVRQFIIEEDGEYDHMEQLRLTLYYKPKAELEELETNLWSTDCNSENEFFSQVENMKFFKVPIENYVPFRCEIEQEEV